MDHTLWAISLRFCEQRKRWRVILARSMEAIKCGDTKVCTRASCENTSDKHCAICKAAYCCIECQKLDWKRHKGICTNPSSNPSSNTTKSNTTKMVRAYDAVRIEVKSLSRVQLENMWNEMFKKPPGDISRMDDRTLRATINLLLLELCSEAGR
jgi:hypothetical protein